MQPAEAGVGDSSAASHVAEDEAELPTEGSGMADLRGRSTRRTPGLMARKAGLVTAEVEERVAEVEVEVEEGVGGRRASAAEALAERPPRTEKAAVSPKEEAAAAIGGRANPESPRSPRNPSHNLHLSA